ncbi:hypothetical protein V7S43_013777 [Phytophthora oleae]|uniref:Ricin B lectin domain-containing protein n=1 Tax=Phytophthora oleae TaxID=2107226 RepID=A0ABD3F310_9STRA
MNRHTGMALEQNLASNLVQALDFALVASTHQWLRIPLGSGYFVYKNVATGKLLEHWELKEGAGNTVAMSDDTNDPKCQWFESKYDDIFIGLRNRASRLFIDHFASSEIRTCAEDLTYVERHWCLIYHHPPRTTPEIVTLKNIESGYLLQKVKGIESCAITDTWQRIPVGSEGYSIYKNAGTGKVLSLSHEGVDLVDADAQDAAQQWRECDIGEGWIAFQNRAFACMLRHSGSDEIDAKHRNIRELRDLWRVERIQPSGDVKTSSENSLHIVENDGPAWMIQPNEISCRSEAMTEGIYYAKRLTLM